MVPRTALASTSAHEDQMTVMETRGPATGDSVLAADTDIEDYAWNGLAQPVNLFLALLFVFLLCRYARLLM